LERKYTDLTSYDSFPTSSTYPKEVCFKTIYSSLFKDENKNPLETEFGLSVYKDHQVFSIQELPECSPPGQLPRSIDVIADDDLADACKPGDRIQIVGLFRVLPNKQNASSSGNFRSILIANNIILMSKVSEPKFEREDVKNIGILSKRDDVVDILARSLAPSIFGHEEVKKAVLCLLLGGSEKVLANGSRLRGDINVLLIGDPSVAKSQILRYVLHTAPRVVATTGRGSSGKN
jgi:DNA replication licensing factor MCM3